MNPVRLFNPFYVLKLERDLVTLVRRVERVVDLVEQHSVDAASPDRMFAATVRSNLMTIADAMATGRTHEAKTMVDAMVLVLGGKDAARR